MMGGDGILGVYYVEMALYQIMDSYCRYTFALL